nr:hypothetical protein [uncultured Ralstonia sp.]
MTEMTGSDVIDASALRWIFAMHKIGRERLQNRRFLLLDCLRIGAARQIIRYAELAIN